MLVVENLVLRRACAEDAPAIQRVLATDAATWALLEGTPLGPDAAAYLLGELPPGVPAERKHVYLADDVCVIDLVEGYPEPGTWYLGLLFLAPAARGQGLGTRILDGIVAHVRAHGGRAVRLAVVVENVRARQLYDRLGFLHVARRSRETAMGRQQVDVLELAVA